MGPLNAPNPSSAPIAGAATASMVEGHLVIQKGGKQTVFRADKPILLAHQSADIRNAICTDPDTRILNPNTMTVGPSGYSSLKPFLQAGALQPGEYETTCAEVLQRFVKGFSEAMRLKGWDVPIVVTHGASDVGVDKSARECAIQSKVRQFGFNQPEWMEYVPNDLVPVYVGSSKDDYHHKFAAHTMVLLLMGGRDDAAYHDRLNGQQYRNLVLPCPVMPFLMKDPPSAWDPLFDRERLGSDPVEWAKRIPILDASQAHLRSSPLPEVERILAGERTRAQLNVLVDYLVDLAVTYVPHRFPDLEKPLNLSDHTLGDLPKS